jgi:hypothetical protein
MGIEEMQPHKAKFDLKSDSSRMELAQLLVGQTATVRRSSGEEEHDWYIKGVHADGIVAAKPAQKIEKKIPLAQFKQMNPELFFNIEVTE